MPTDRLNFEYISKLGTINLNISSEYYQLSSSRRIDRFSNVQHSIVEYTHGKIHIREFLIPKYRLSENVSTNLFGWSIMIESDHDNLGTIQFACRIGDCPKGGIATGENLDALEFTNDLSYDLHMGTEDAESMMWRAKSNYFMPERFFNFLSNESEDFADKTFSRLYEDGIQTEFPVLLKTETIKFHYLIAESNLVSENDVRNWLAVNLSIDQIDVIINDLKNNV